MRILFTGGGTAGHINPALAIAQIFQKNFPNVEIAFVGVRGGKEEDLVIRAGFPLYFVRVMGVKRSISFSNIKAFWLAAHSPYAKETVEILNFFHPDLVIGTGGYACWPIMACAARMQIPTALHESNVIPGLAVRRLQKKVDSIWVNFEETKDFLKVPEKVIRVGNPLQKGFMTLSKSEARAKLGIPADQMMILSFGGSLGAKNLNTAVLELMKNHISKNPKCLMFHATGKGDYERCKQLQIEVNLPAASHCILSDYFYDMPLKMAAADIVISRAGAMTLSELAQMKKAAILIPSPFVANNHQYKNAKVLADAGAAILVLEENLPQKALDTAVMEVLESAGKRKSMELEIAKFGDEKSNQRILQEALSLLKQKK